MLLQKGSDLSQGYANTGVVFKKEAIILLCSAVALPQWESGAHFEQFK